MCTCILAGKNATVTGRAMLGANDDWENVKGVLTEVARKEYAPGSRYTLVGGLEIPQVAKTCAYTYTACDYSIGNLDRAWAGGCNDRGVAVAGTGVDAWKEYPWRGFGYGLEPDDIPLLILQRAKTARHAVELIAELIQEYGLRPSYFEGAPGSSCATFSVADKEEAWVLEVLAGRHYLATRVPDDEVSVRVNAFGTHDADLTDAANTVSSPGLADFAREQFGWEGEESCFDFAGIFGSETSPTEWGPELDPMNIRRRWRAMQLLTGEEESVETLRYHARPDRLLGKDDFARVLADVYEGTPFDLTVDAEGKPADPLRADAPDYAICRQWTVASIIVPHDDDTIRIAMGPPLTTQYKAYHWGR